MGAGADGGQDGHAGAGDIGGRGGASTVGADNTAAVGAGADGGQDGHAGAGDIGGRGGASTVGADNTAAVAQSEEADARGARPMLGASLWLTAECLMHEIAPDIRGRGSGNCEPGC
ncbi:hypothetical protein BST16_09300 [Mycobacterium asiaticum DSM 44297]|nr:hypothetical protein BST16_09300 [Mycobacterium asiaticum DSM 44297]